MSLLSKSECISCTPQIFFHAKKLYVRINMKASLYLLKKQNGRTEFTMKTDVQVVVVDLDRSKEYPLNFVCILPLTLVSFEKHSNAFSKIFGISRLDVAIKLLQRALKKEKDDECRKELTKRLKVLKPAFFNRVLTAN